MICLYPSKVLFRMKLRSLAFALVLAAFAGCSPRTEAEDPPRAEVVGSPSEDRLLGFAQDGDSVLVVRAHGLDRIDRAGVTARIAGEEYRACPADPSAVWGPRGQERFSATVLEVRDGIVTMADPSCGVWARDLASGSSKMLASKDADANWPSWAGRLPAVVAVDEAGVVVCFSAGRADEPVMTEVWSLGREGSEHHRIAQLPDADGCGAIFVDGETVFVAASAPTRQEDVRDVLYRVDRRDGTLTLISAVRLITGITQDKEAIYYIDDGAVERVTKRGLERQTLEPRHARAHWEGSSLIGSQPQSGLMANGTFLYWFGSRLTGTDFRQTIERRRIAGGEPEDAV